MRPSRARRAPRPRRRRTGDRHRRAARAQAAAQIAAVPARVGVAGGVGGQAVVRVGLRRRAPPRSGRAAAAGARTTAAVGSVRGRGRGRSRRSRPVSARRMPWRSSSPSGGEQLDRVAVRRRRPAGRGRRPRPKAASHGTSGACDLAEACQAVADEGVDPARTAASSPRARAPGHLHHEQRVAVAGRRRCGTGRRRARSTGSARRWRPAGAAEHSSWQRAGRRGRAPRTSRRTGGVVSSSAGRAAASERHAGAAEVRARRSGAAPPTASSSQWMSSKSDAPAGARPASPSSATTAS